MNPEWERLAAEIERLRRRYAFLFEEPPAASAAGSVWDVAEDTLRWHVLLPGTLEPDIDIEVLADVIVVRGATSDAADTFTFSQAVLPVPAPYDVTRVAVRYEGEMLEIRVSRAAER
jgi:hypothetical protein